MTVGFLSTARRGSFGPFCPCAVGLSPLVLLGGIWDDNGRLKVAHLTSVHAPGDARITYKECAALAAAGHDVVLVAPGTVPDFPDGVRLKSVPVPRTRMERICRTTFQVVRVGVHERARLYHLHDPELLPFAPLLRARGARVIFDAHEDLPHDVREKVWIPKALRPAFALAIALLLRLAEFACTAVVAATPAIARRFRRHTVVVANYPDLTAHGTAVPFIQRERAVAYVGSITRDRGIEQLVRAMSLPRLDGITLVLAGPFETPELLAEMRALEGWSRVRYVGAVRPTDVPALLSRVRAGLVTLLPRRNFVESIPTKLYEYLGNNIPAIASSCLRAAEILEREGCGVVVDPYDTEGIATAIGFLVDHPELSQTMGERGGRVVAERYRWKNEAEKLTGLYDAIA